MRVQIRATAVVAMNNNFGTTLSALAATPTLLLWKISAQTFLKNFPLIVGGAKKWKLNGLMPSQAPGVAWCGPFLTGTSYIGS